MKLKTLLLTNSLLVSMFICNAQDSTRTLFKLIRPSSIGLIVEPQIGYGPIRGSNTEIATASVLIIVNHNWALGATASSTIREEFVPKAIQPLSVQAYWIGGKLEYTIRPNALVHLSIPISLGFGEARVDSLGANRNDRDFFDEEDDHDSKNDTISNENGFGVLQPGLHLEMNLLKYVKFYIGADYRFSFLTENKTSYLPANSLQGFTFSAGFRMGLFDYKICKKNSSGMDGMN